MSVKVPEVNKDGKRISWKETKRNQWVLENIGLRGVERSPHSETTIAMNSPENLMRLQQKQAQFKQNASEMLRKEKSITRGISNWLGISLYLSVVRWIFISFHHDFRQQLGGIIHIREMPDMYWYSSVNRGVKYASNIFYTLYVGYSG